MDPCRENSSVCTSGFVDGIMFGLAEVTLIAHILKVMGIFSWLEDGICSYGIGKL